MKTFKLNKLVKDGIVERMREQGQTPEVTVLDDTEFRSELYKKLREEGRELGQAKTTKDRLKERHDVLDVLRQIALLDTVDNVRNLTVTDDQPGAFSQRQFVGRVTMPDNNDWVEYYQSEPDRFIETDDHFVEA